MLSSFLDDMLELSKTTILQELQQLSANLVQMPVGQKSALKLNRDIDSVKVVLFFIAHKYC